MATAVETGSEPRTPSPPMSLPVASLLGAVYVVAAAIAGVFYAVPTIWKDAVTPLRREHLRERGGAAGRPVDPGWRADLVRPQTARREPAQGASRRHFPDDHNGRPGLLHAGAGRR